MIAICAVASGARSFAAIAEWAADTAAVVLAQIGVGTADVSTIRRTLNRVDAQAFDQALAGWAQKATTPAAIAVDGKEPRGAKNGGGAPVRLLSALDQDTAVVLGQVEVGEKSNEIPQFPVLLDQFGDLNEVVVTADALHAQRSHATYLRSRGADYLFTVKGNQPRLYRQLACLP